MLIPESERTYMEIGVATSVLSHYRLEDAIDIASECGYDFLDIWGGRPHLFRDDYSLRQIGKLRDSIEQKGVRVNCVMPAFFGYPFDLFYSSTIAFRESIDYVLQNCRNASALGAKHILVCPGRLVHGQDPEETLERFESALARICGECTALGLTVLLEPVNRQTFDLIYTAKIAQNVVKRIGVDNLGIVLDTGHMHLENESIEDAVDAAGNLLLHIHLNDNDGTSQTNLIPGDGSFDFRRCFSALRAAKYKGNVTIEIGGRYRGNPIPAIQESLRRVRGLLTPC